MDRILIDAPNQSKTDPFLTDIWCVAVFCPPHPDSGTVLLSLMTAGLYTVSISLYTRVKIRLYQSKKITSNPCLSQLSSATSFIYIFVQLP